MSFNPFLPENFIPVDFLPENFLPIQEGTPPGTGSPVEGPSVIGPTQVIGGPPGFQVIGSGVTG